MKGFLEGKEEYWGTAPVPVWGEIVYLPSPWRVTHDREVTIAKQNQAKQEEASWIDAHVLYLLDNVGVHENHRKWFHVGEEGQDGSSLEAINSSFVDKVIFYYPLYPFASVTIRDPYYSKCAVWTSRISIK